MKFLSEHGEVGGAHTKQAEGLGPLTAEYVVHHVREYLETVQFGLCLSAFGIALIMFGIVWIFRYTS